MYQNIPFLKKNIYLMANFARPVNVKHVFKIKIPYMYLNLFIWNYENLHLVWTDESAHPDQDLGLSLTFCIVVWYLN